MYTVRIGESSPPIYRISDSDRVLVFGSILEQRCHYSGTKRGSCSWETYAMRRLVSLLSNGCMRSNVPIRARAYAICLQKALDRRVRIPLTVCSNFSAARRRLQPGEVASDRLLPNSLKDDLLLSPIRRPRCVQYTKPTYSKEKSMDITAKAGCLENQTNRGLASGYDTPRTT
jgi:hypothetical protein